MSSLIILLAMFVLLWAVLIRPQRMKQRVQQQMLSQIDSGDEVLTVGGIYGIVVEVEDDDDLVVEIAEGIHVRISRRAVATVVKPEEEDEDAEADDEIIEADAQDVTSEEDAEGLVTVPDTEATIEATQRRLFRRR